MFCTPTLARCENCESSIIQFKIDYVDDEEEQQSLQMRRHWAQNRSGIKPLLHQTSRSSPPHLPVTTISCAFGVCVHTHVPEILKGSVYMLLTYWNIVCNVGFQSVSSICVNLSLTFTNPCIYSLPVEARTDDSELMKPMTCYTMEVCVQEPPPYCHISDLVFSL